MVVNIRHISKRRLIGWMEGVGRRMVGGGVEIVMVVDKSRMDRCKPKRPNTEARSPDHQQHAVRRRRHSNVLKLEIRQCRPTSHAAVEAECILKRLG